MPENVQAAEYVPFESLVPWNRNPRNNEDAIPKVMRSLEAFGFGRPLIAWGSTGPRRLVVGHTTFAAYSKLVAKNGEDWCPGGTPAPGMVPVRWRDDWTEEEAAGYAIADNRLGEIATWDDEVLAELLGELELGDVDLDAVGYSEADLDGLVERPEPPEAPEPEAPPEEPVSRAGEVYELGPHRLVCGDCLEAPVWEALLGEERLAMVWTDPPYGVSYNSHKPGDLDAWAKTRRRDGLRVKNDDLTEDELQAFIGDAFALLIAHTEPGAVWYVAGPAGPLHLIFGAHLHRLGVYRQQIQWVKDRFAFGRSDYHYRHEPIFYGWTPGGAHYFVDDRTQDTVHEVARPSVSKEHPTMKPLALIERHLNNSSRPGDIVGDPFGGSGSTLLACARTGRVARLIELDPRYCDVIRRRWTQWATEAGVDPGPGALS